MASTGNVFAGTGENNAGIGATAWTSPGSVTADDATDATCNAAASSQYHVSRNFGFTIPADATIHGITVRVEASEHTAGTESLNAQLQDASGTLVGSSKSATISGTAKAVYTYGATNDVWGAALTPAIVNDADFGVRVWFTTAHDVRIDYVTLAVEYSVPPISKIFANGQSPAQIMGLVGFAGAAALWGAAELAPLVASDLIPQPTSYSLSTRSLAQPSPVFSRVVIPPAATPLPKAVITLPQQPDVIQPVFSGPQPYSTSYLPPLAWALDGQRDLNQPQAWFAHQLLNPAPAQIIRPFAAPLAQVPEQPSAWFAKWFFPPVQPQVNRPFSTPAAQAPEQVPAWFSKIPPAPVPQLVRPLTTQQALDSLEQPQAWFSKLLAFPQPEAVLRGLKFTDRYEGVDLPQPFFNKYFFEPVATQSPPLRPTVAIQAEQVTELLQPVFSGQTPESVAPPAEPVPVSSRYSLSTRELTQISPWFTKAPPPSVEPPPPPPPPPLGPAKSTNPQVPWNPPPVFYKLSEPLKLPTVAFSGIAPHLAPSGQAWFAKFPLTSVAPTAPPLRGLLTVLPQQPDAQQPVFKRHPPPSVAVTLVPSTPSLALQPRRLDQPAPVFFRQPPASVAGPAVLPSAELHANWQQVQEILQPTFKRSIPPSVAPPPLPALNPNLWAAPQAWLEHSQPVFSRQQPAAAVATLPTVALLPNWAQRVEPVQPSFSKRFFSPPVFPPPNRPHIFATGQTDTQQPPALFFHAPPPSVAPPSPAPPGSGSVGGGALGGGDAGAKLRRFFNEVVKPLPLDRKREAVKQLEVLERRPPAEQLLVLAQMSPDLAQLDTSPVAYLHAELMAAIEEEEEVQFILTWFLQP